MMISPEHEMYRGSHRKYYIPLVNVSERKDGTECPWILYIRILSTKKGRPIMCQLQWFLLLPLQDYTATVTGSLGDLYWCDKYITTVIGRLVDLYRFDKQSYFLETLKIFLGMKIQFQQWNTTDLHMSIYLLFTNCFVGCHKYLEVIGLFLA